MVFRQRRFGTICGMMLAGMGLIGAQATYAEESRAAAPSGAVALETAAQLNTLADVLRLLPRKTVAAAVIYPAQLLDSRAVRRLPADLTVADFKLRYGVDVTQIEFAVPFLEQPDNSAPHWGIVLRYREPVNWREMPASLLDQTAFGEQQGRPYRRGRRSSDYSVYSLDAQTVVIALDSTLQRMLELSNAAEQPLIHRLYTGIDKQIDLHLFVDVAQLRPLLERHLDQAGKGSDAWSAWGQVAEATDSLELRLRLTNELALGIVAVPNPAIGASSLKQRCDDWVIALRAAGDPSNGPLAERVHGDADGAARGPSSTMPDAPGAVLGYCYRMLDVVLPQYTSQLVGDSLQIGFRGNATAHATACAAVTMLLSPTFEAAMASIDRLHNWQLPPEHAGAARASLR